MGAPGVDAPSGRVPLPDEGEVRVARSVQLSSAQLGLVAKVDLLEGATDGTVVPIETKRGSPPDNPERSWEPERVQVCVQALLLRAHGYVVDHGILYFAETRERVVVPIDEEIVARTLELVRGLREVASSAVPPPPLIDSPKCPRCSLVGICLPDETNTLATRAAMPRRRLIPSDDTPKPLYVTEQGAWVTKSKGRVEISKKGEALASVRLIDVSQVCVYGNAQISTQLLRAHGAGHPGLLVQLRGLVLRNGDWASRAQRRSPPPPSDRCFSRGCGDRGTGRRREDPQ